MPTIPSLDFARTSRAIASDAAGASSRDNAGHESSSAVGAPHVPPQHANATPSPPRDYSGTSPTALAPLPQDCAQQWGAANPNAFRIPDFFSAERSSEPSHSLQNAMRDVGGGAPSNTSGSPEAEIIAAESSTFEYPSSAFKKYGRGGERYCMEHKLQQLMNEKLAAERDKVELARRLREATSGSDANGSSAPHVRLLPPIVEDSDVFSAHVSGGVINAPSASLGGPYPATSMLGTAGAARYLVETADVFSVSTAAGQTQSSRMNALAVADGASRAATSEEETETNARLRSAMISLASRDHDQLERCEQKTCPAAREKWRSVVVFLALLLVAFFTLQSWRGAAGAADADLKRAVVGRTSADSERTAGGGEQRVAGPAPASMVSSARDEKDTAPAPGGIVSSAGVGNEEETSAAASSWRPICLAVSSAAAAVALGLGLGAAFCPRLSQEEKKRTAAAGAGATSSDDAVSSDCCSPPAADEQAALRALDSRARRAAAGRYEGKGASRKEPARLSQEAWTEKFRTALRAEPRSASKHQALCETLMNNWLWQNEKDARALSRTVRANEDWAQVDTRNPAPHYYNCALHSHLSRMDRVGGMGARAHTTAMALAWERARALPWVSFRYSGRLILKVCSEDDVFVMEPAKALAALQDVSRDSSTNKAERARAYSAMGRLLERTGQVDEAEEAHINAIGVMRAYLTVGLSPFGLSLSDLFSNLDVLLQSVAKGREEGASRAHKAYERCMKSEEMKEHFAQAHENVLNEAKAYTNWGAFFRKRGEKGNAEVAFRMAVQLEAKLPADDRLRQVRRQEIQEIDAIRKELRSGGTAGGDSRGRGSGDIVSPELGSKLDIVVEEDEDWEDDEAEVLLGGD